VARAERFRGDEIGRRWLGRTDEGLAPVASAGVACSPWLCGVAAAATRAMDPGATGPEPES